MQNKYWFLLAGLGLGNMPLANDLESPPLSPHHTVIDTQKRLQDKISHAITAFEQTPREDWSFRLTRHENEEGDITSSIEIFNPTKAAHERWTLLRSNGEIPNQKQIRKYIKGKQKGAKNSEEQGVSMRLRDIVQLESLQLTSEDEMFINASFEVSLVQLGEEAAKHLKGTLTYVKEQAFIERIVIVNTAPFSPMFSAKITDFTLSFRFTKINAAILRRQHDLSMKGSFAFFTEIDEVSKDVFSDYKYVGQSIAKQPN
ncbi:hypothetical protein [Agaribacter marinus]|uniref:Uncharacterized protein n=1 Tax=Agaribacter marinus TaxID=1431249 RepID=A0AA37WIV6_9ALTE|nr:hypothetical protein [Agaribacter marinus]GLR71567.1 hypothetical protein GCM10007852_24750 [Agaribacter marinus]